MYSINIRLLSSIIPSILSLFLLPIPLVKDMMDCVEEEQEGECNATDRRGKKEEDRASSDDDVSIITASRWKQTVRATLQQAQ